VTQRAVSSRALEDEDDPAASADRGVALMIPLKLHLPLLLACASLLVGCSDDGAGETKGSASGGAAGVSGSSTTAGASSSSGGNGSAGSSAATPSTEKFSFFVTSLKRMRELSGSDDGFGGDLRFGESGDGAGLRGADKICSTIADKSMPGNNKTWRAFLSATRGEDGQPVNAIDRVGEGPWYDRLGRLVAQNKANLVGVRPTGADEAIIDDLPNEDGVPNHAPDPGEGDVDNHDILTGTDDEGKLYSMNAGSTCNDWTSAVGETGKPRCGHSWPRSGGGGPAGGGGFSGENWMSALNEAGCAPGAFIIEMGPPGANGTLSVGDGGGYGGIYCFSLNP
jgi:hypothetical protein